MDPIVEENGPESQANSMTRIQNRLEALK